MGERRGDTDTRSDVPRESVRLRGLFTAWEHAGEYERSAVQLTVLSAAALVGGIALTIVAGVQGLRSPLRVLAAWVWSFVFPEGLVGSTLRRQYENAPDLSVVGAWVFGSAVVLAVFAALLLILGYLHEIDADDRRLRRSYLAESMPKAPGSPADILAVKQDGKQQS